MESFSQVVRAAADIRECGPACAVISLGKEGALLSSGVDLWLARSPAVEERNPIGAGDSMMGELVYGVHAGMDFCEALRWEIACGAGNRSKRCLGESGSNESNVKLAIRPLTPDLWPALEDLFGNQGPVIRCWCMYWRIGNEYRKRPAEANEDAFRDQVQCRGEAKEVIPN